jgi:uncharacterized protein YecE (DUF72 family)
MLDFYCRSFPLVELNFTFYRPPTASVLERMAEQTPPGFQFLVKIPRTLSHDEDPKDLPGFRIAVEALHQRSQLSGLLCQLPQATHRTRRHVAWLERLARELGAYRLAVEFRHRSWANPDVTPWMKQHHLDLVSVDVPDLPNLYPHGLVQSSERLYVRFHSRKAKNWYASGPERYDYDFPREVLSEWATSLSQAADRAQEAFLLFNNCADGQAAVNAFQMRPLLAQIAPQLDVLAPFPPPETDGGQGSLFD